MERASKVVNDFFFFSFSLVPGFVKDLVPRGMSVESVLPEGFGFGLFLVLSFQSPHKLKLG